MSQSRKGDNTGRAFFFSILAMFGMLGLVGGGVLMMIRVAGRPTTPTDA